MSGRVPREIGDPLATEADTLRRHAVQRPTKTAILFNGRATSYAELNLRSDQVANALIGLAPDRQTRIGLLTKNSDLFFEVLFGAAKSARVAMPLNWRLTPRELADILRDSGARALFVGAEFEHVIPQLVEFGVNLETVITLESPGYVHWRDRHTPDEPLVDVKPEDIFIQLYTSGTTGLPKGVQISHRASIKMRGLEVSTNGEWTRWGPEDSAIVAMPNFHVGGTSWALQWLARGATCVVHAQVDPRAMLDAIDVQGVGHLFAVPTVLAMMLEDPSCTERDFSRLKLIHYGAAPISPPLLSRCMQTFKAGFVQYYGMTETNGVVSVLEPQDHDLSRPHLLTSVGKPYPAVELRIMDAKGNRLEPLAIGEVCVKSPCLMSGYWQNSEATAQSMSGDYYRTGDAGYLDENGYLYLVDRVKDMIVTGGENVYPIEIERALMEHPSVADAAVIGVPDPRWGEAVKAIIVTKGAPVAPEALISFLRERIGGFKIPRTIDFVTELPRNAAGKVLKRSLRSRYID